MVRTKGEARRTKDERGDEARRAKDGRKDTTQANGYVMTPFGEGDIDYSTFFRRVGAKGSHNPMWEQDTAPGGGANPGQSLQLAALSYENLAALRG